MMKSYGTLVFAEHRKQMTTRVFSVRAADLKRGTRPKDMGRVEFYLLRDKYLRPSTFHVVAQGKVQRITPDTFIQLIKEATNILLSKGIPRSLRKRIHTMLKTFNPSAKVGSITLCEFCLINNKLTWMTTRGFHALGREVCESCALSELKRELERYQIPFDSSMRRLARRLLHRTRDADFVMRSLQPGTRQPIQPKYTLFNIRSALNFTKQQNLRDLKLPPPLKEVLKREKISELMPVQVLAIQNGLLEGRNLLVVSETSSGKTLIAELVGITKILNNRQKMIYLTPLVALANNKNVEFSRRYKQLGIRIGIRVGVSRIAGDDSGLMKEDTDVSRAQIIVGTYEGIDFLLRRGGRAVLGEVGTIVIDEVQMLTDEERGPELDGLIARLRQFYPTAQLIALSATVGNPVELTQDLGLHLVQLEGRPVPLEEHLLVTMEGGDKLSRIIELVEREWTRQSSYGFRGQTLIFTNARRKTQQISSSLRNAGLRASAYHAGFSYGRRRFVEDQFANGKLQAVVATYALGAGVDFPASQVVFENLCMGNRYLTVSEFTQMTGRAGRLGKHDKGKTFLLASPVQGCAGHRDLTETTAALELLSGKVEPVDPEYDDQISAEQFLACLAATKSQKEAKKAYSQLIGVSVSSENAIALLEKEKLVARQEGEIAITPFGRASSVSFFSLEKAKKVKNALAQGTDPLNLALELHPLENVYIASNVHSVLERAFGTKFSTRVFSGSTLDVMDASLGGMHKKLPKWILELFVKWSRTFFNCNCDESPYCNCAQQKIGRYLVRLRQQGNTPRRMTQLLQKNYSFFVYDGDVFDWLDGLVHILEGISRVAKALNYQKLGNIASDYARFIEQPSKKENKSTAK